MKKTITINLAGVVFHIEEDAYQILQQYLESIKKHFKNVVGGADIQGDIENRIAEIFTDNLSPSKQAITIEDVNHVMKQMGSVEDMVDEELENEFNTTSKEGSTGAGSSETFSQSFQNKKLFRDSSNGIIAGVFAGIAAYFGVNPLWIRLAALAFTFGFFFLPAFAGTMILGYLVLWISMPASAFVENPGQFKKFFRSRKDQVVAGVSGGLGAYFGIDPVIIRVLFVLTTIFGAGIVIYIVLWAITPEAKTVTDELQMQGDPVTLNNIEEQIRKNVSIQDENTKNRVVKAAAFPFRLLTMVVTALGGLFKLIFDILRFGLGLLLLFISAVFLFAISIATLAALGIVNQGTYNVETAGIPLARMADEINIWMVGFGGLTCVIPGLLIFLLAISLMANKSMLKSVTMLILVSLFIVGLVGTAFTIIPVVSKFSSEGTEKVERNFESKAQLIDLRMNQVDRDLDKYHATELEIHGTPEKEIKLVQTFESHGSTWKEARENARNIQYNVLQQDSSLIFDSNISLDPAAPFRFQNLKLDLYIPYGRTFRMDRELAHILRNTLYPYDYDESQMEGNVWMYSPKGLKCLTCTTEDQSSDPEPATEPSKQNSDDEDF